MVRSVVLVCLGAVAVANVAAAQTPPPPPPPGSNMTFGDGNQADAAPVVGTGSISGIVTDGTTGAPVAGALVQLVGGAGQAGSRPRQMTDAKGRFIFTQLPAFPDYTLIASRVGYLEGGYRRQPGAPIQVRIGLKDGEWFTGGNITMYRPSAISGTVVDERGDPLVGIPVRVLVSALVGGHNRWAAGQTVLTDDRGAYRIAGLMAGRYVVHVPSVQVTLPSGEAALYRTVRPAGTAATDASQTSHVIRASDGTGMMVGHFPAPPPDGRGSAYPMVFHPSARSLATAEVIALEFAEERAAVDVQMRPVPTVTISGIVSGPPEAVGGVAVRLMPAGSESLGLGSEAALTKADSTGAFTLHQVPEGDYVLLTGRAYSEYRLSSASSSAQRLAPSGLNPFVSRMSSSQVAGANGIMFSTQGMQGVDAPGRLALSVGNQSMTGIVVPSVRAVKVSGRFQWDGSDTRPAAAEFGPSVRLEPADGDLMQGMHFAMSPRATPGAPGPTTFTIDNVVPGRYVIGEIAASTFRLVGAEWNGRNLIDTPLEVDGEGDITNVVIKLAAVLNSVTGVVRDAAGRVATDGAVLTFPANPEAWKMMGISAQRFRTSTIVADGTYRVTLLVPGDYLLAAVPMEDRGKWVDPEFLASLAATAVRLKIDANTVVTQELRLSGGGR